MRHVGQMEYWWSKVKVQFDTTLLRATDRELDDMVLSILSVELPHYSDYDANNIGRHPEIAPQVRDVLMVYFRKCLEIGCAPNERTCEAL